MEKVVIEASLDLLEQGYYELSFAFEGLSDENVWKRPAGGLLSIGELAGHMAYWEAIRLAGPDDDPANCTVKSILIDARFQYFPKTLAELPTAEHLAMTAQQVLEEIVRVHRESIAAFRHRNPDPDSVIPGCPAGFTYRQYLEYAVFHTAYHIGQMYSVRHLLGDVPPDN